MTWIFWGEFCAQEERYSWAAFELADEEEAEGVVGAGPPKSTRAAGGGSERGEEGDLSAGESGAGSAMGAGRATPSARLLFLERAYGLLEVPGTYPGTYS